MLPALLRAIERYSGSSWRVTTTRSGDDYLLDIECGRSLVRIGGKSVEHAEQRAAALLERRAAMKKAAFQDRNLESVLGESLAQRRRERGEPQLRLVPDPATNKPQDGGASDAGENADEEEPRG